MGREVDGERGEGGEGDERGAEDSSDRRHGLVVVGSRRCDEDGERAFQAQVLFVILLKQTPAAKRPRGVKGDE
jgi:hypothetical protein